jgi:hypothetical protein
MSSFNIPDTTPANLALIKKAANRAGDLVRQHHTKWLHLQDSLLQHEACKHYRVFANLSLHTNINILKTTHNKVLREMVREVIKIQRSMAAYMKEAKKKYKQEMELHQTFSTMKR